jgi:flagellar hook-associated protein 3 FlgL
MRVTQNSTMRNYLRNMHRTLADRGKSNERLSSQRSFNKVSEDTAAAARAFAVRSQYAKNLESLSAIKNASSELSAAETNINSMNAILTNVTDRILRIQNNTMPQDQKEIIAKEIEGLNEQILQFANAKFGDHYLFSGSNNTEPPFTRDQATGKYLYNGIDPDKVRKNPTTGELEYLKSTGPDVYEAVPKNKDYMIDIGLGLRVTATGEVDTRSAFTVASSGIYTMGYGTSVVDGEPVTNNILNLLTEIAAAIRSGDAQGLDRGLTQVKAQSEGLIMSMTDIGSRDAFLDQITKRLENDNINLLSAQSDLEGVDLEYETIMNKSYETAWLITLQLGSKVIPPSIFDFMR